jgi:hypothetical protein
MEKGEPQKGVLPPGTSPAPLAPPPAGKDGGGSADKLGAFKDLDKSAAAGGRFPLSEYKFPGLIGPIFEGRLDDVPDDRATRGIVFSIVKGYADFCGPTPADVAMHAMPYASDLARQIYRNPAEGGFKVLEEILKSAAKAQREGPMAGIEDFLRKHGVVFQDGVDDARMLVERHQCAGKVQGQFYANLSRLISSRSSREPAAFDDVKFWALMSPAYRRLHNIPDPAVELARRRTEALTTAALQNCRTNFDRPAFCDCAVRNLDGLKLDDRQWSVLADFRAVAALSKERSEVVRAVRSCF